MIIEIANALKIGDIVCIDWKKHNLSKQPVQITTQSNFDAYCYQESVHANQSTIDELRDSHVDCYYYDVTLIQQSDILIQS